MVWRIESAREWEWWAVLDAEELARLGPPKYWGRLAAEHVSESQASLENGSWRYGPGVAEGRVLLYRHE